MMVKRLSAKAVDALKTPGKHRVDDGLYLRVTQAGGRTWSMRYMLAGKAREMGLGPYPTVTLAEARDKAGEAKRLLATGQDPLNVRAGSTSIPFDEAADRYIETHKAGWSNAKHAQQWANTLRVYASPKIGGKPVSDITAVDVLSVLQPIWTAKPETASRVRMRIEAILDWASVHKFRDAEKPNPARWKGHLEHALPKRSKVATVKHHAAIHWPEIPAFWATLAQTDGAAACALSFLILTAARTGEVTGAVHAEVDHDAGTWTVPAARMKARRDHRVPLSTQALAILGSGREGPLFAGPTGKPLSNMAMAMLMRRLGFGGFTVHGFRSSFRDWVSEATDFQGEIAEAALAHIVGDKTEAAYRRGDLFEKRRALMQAWADFVTGAQDIGA